MFSVLSNGDFIKYITHNVIIIGRYHRLFIKKKKKNVIIQVDDQLPFQGNFCLS